nr:flagellar assembly protein FliW [uncultured Desulfobacter sp.]
MKINTRQFGEMSIDGDKIINMPDGIPGFRQQKRYVILEKKETSPFYLFQCVDDPNLAFVVMDPLRFYPEYTLSVKDFDNTIKWEFAKEELSCFVIITIPKGKPEDMTANFMAPIVINNERKEGMQLILQGSPYSHQQLLLK